ncbi:MAG: hypothetical protein BWY82_02887 [Verrucomicrobia bacterium ADurb.Bin474]|nr:MAG: hypothetical protein BWY82_02887 [Verrucomicrobia bacterium ADurb.Bin474]
MFRHILTQHIDRIRRVLHKAARQWLTLTDVKIPAPTDRVRWLYVVWTISIIYLAVVLVIHHLGADRDPLTLTHPEPQLRIHR